MATETIVKAVDYYLDVLNSISTKAVIPPSVNITCYGQTSYPSGECFLRACARTHANSSRVYAVKYSLVTSAEGTLGPVTIEEYQTLSDEIEAAVSEYRLQNFRKISRQQRHAKDEDKSFRRAWNKV